MLHFLCFFHSLQLQKTWKCFQWKWLNMQPVINFKNFWKISLRKGIPTLHPLKSGVGTDYCNIDERPRDSLTTRVGRVFRQLCNRPPKLDTTRSLSSLKLKRLRVLFHLFLSADMYRRTIWLKVVWNGFLKVSSNELCKTRPGIQFLIIIYQCKRYMHLERGKKEYVPQEINI